MSNLTSTQLITSLHGSLSERVLNQSQQNNKQAINLIESLTININTIPKRRRIDKSQLQSLQSSLRVKDTQQEQDIYDEILSLEAEQQKLASFQDSLLIQETQKQDMHQDNIQQGFEFSCILLQELFSANVIIE
ncbi:hypothetical protein SS50377_23050 [Spironucleus salmonicida]|uniref:Uncharacterized protein n=1 Tax=Spironucleus salmonicida TaxID=348837 RepID=V6LSI1_9EUKA|nr:hypothetical protein SS50377_23050 [Spironucleus salmonicida]|eukprot:EST47627.1 Hypothetical protein SS50377_12321 [Spironucleus salmonicida]